MSSVVDSPATVPMQQSLLARWLVFAILFALLLALYFDGWHSMKRVWDIPTYTHGYVVPLIAAWLAWRQRHALAGLRPATGWMALAGIACCGLLWLAGELAGVNAARHFALMGMAVLLVPLVFGWQVTRRLLFPLGFLFFAVPFGEFLLPTMMEATAAVTIWLVSLSGVPIYREGLSFILPSGSWEIVEECSGQRYLIATLPLACLYAWLSFQRNRTRWLFVLFAIVVAVLANWLRAWGIVMLGHISGMTIATGVDHLVYGWGFFGIVMGLLFWFGSYWTEASIAENGSKAAIGSTPPAGSSGPSRIVATVLAGALMLAAWTGLSGYLQSRDSVPLDLAEVVAGAAGFFRVGAAPGSLGPTGYRPAYAGARQEVLLHAAGPVVSAWIGSYEHQDEGAEMIGHANSIRSRSMTDWNVVEERVLPRSATKPEVSEHVLASHGNQLLVWRSYIIDGHATASDTRSKLLTAWRVARGRGDRSLVLILWTPLDGLEAQPRTQARSRLQEAMQQLAPSLATADRGTR